MISDAAVVSVGDGAIQSLLSGRIVNGTWCIACEILVAPIFHSNCTHFNDVGLHTGLRVRLLERVEGHEYERSISQKVAGILVCKSSVLSLEQVVSGDGLIRRVRW